MGDLTIEVFSLDVFRHLWKALKLTNILLPRTGTYECAIVPISCVQKTVHATFIRNKIFHGRVSKIVEEGVATFSKSQLDFYLFIKNQVDVFIPHKEMIVFDKVLMSLALVSEMGIQSRKYRKSFIYHTPLCWALYFNTELSEEFFVNGGWKEFEIHLISYLLFTSENCDFLGFSCGNSDDLTFAKYLLKNKCDLYIFPDLKSRFRQINSRRSDKNNISCEKCYPLHAALKSLTFREENMKDYAKLVEGYLRLILLQVDFKEFQNIVSDLIHEHGTSLQYKCSSEEEKTELVRLMVETQHPLRDILKLRLTESYLTRIFAAPSLQIRADSSSTDADSVHSEFSIDLERLVTETCIFCARDPNRNSESFKEANLRKQIKLIKTAIRSTVEKVKSLEERKSFENNSTESSASDEQVCEVSKKAEKLVSEHDQEEKIALHRFYVLGGKPHRTNNVMVLNDTNFEDNVQANDKINKKKKKILKK